MAIYQIIDVSKDSAWHVDKDSPHYLIGAIVSDRTSRENYKQIPLDLSCYKHGYKHGWLRILNVASDYLNPEEETYINGVKLKLMFP